MTPVLYFTAQILACVHPMEVPQVASCISQIKQHIEAPDIGGCMMWADTFARENLPSRDFEPYEITCRRENL
jgi:hypothetical protein